MLLRLFVKLTGFLPLWLLYFVRASGLKHLRSGKCILVANHSSLMDAVLLNILLPTRRIDFLCSPRLFRCPRLCQAFLRSFGAVPLNDTAGGLDSIRACAANPDPTRIVGFFAQGRITSSGSSFRPGAAILALQTGLPLVPVYIHAAPVWRGGSRIRVGEPIPVARRDRIDADEVSELTLELYRRVYELSAPKG